MKIDQLNDESGPLPVAGQMLIELQGGVKVDAAQAKEALFQAMLIIEKIGTPGIEYAWPQADR